MNIENYLLLDIETVPQHPDFSFLDEQWQQLWVEKSSRFKPEGQFTPEQAYAERAGILAEFGQIICISTGYFQRDKNGRLCLQLQTIYGHQEKKLLEAFSTLSTQFCFRKKIFEFAGHNIKEFDIPFICRRMTAHRIPLPPFLQLNNQKPWETNIFDTMNWWKFGDYKNYISLKLLCAVLGVQTSKEGMDGGDVKDVYYRDRDLARIAEYCAGDVQAVAGILMRFLGEEQLHPAKTASLFNII